MDTLGGREGSHVGVYMCHGQAGNQVRECGRYHSNDLLCSLGVAYFLGVWFQ